MKEKDKYALNYEGNFVGRHVHAIVGKEAQFSILNGGSRGHADYVAEKIKLSLNMHEDLVEKLSKLEDIISGIEADADNKGLDLSEARAWWVDARELLDKLEDQKEAR